MTSMQPAQAKIGELTMRVDPETNLASFERVDEWTKITIELIVSADRALMRVVGEHVIILDWLVYKIYSYDDRDVTVELVDVLQ